MTSESVCQSNEYLSRVGKDNIMMWLGESKHLLSPKPGYIHNRICVCEHVEFHWADSPKLVWHFKTKSLFQLGCVCGCHTLPTEQCGLIVCTSTLVHWKCVIFTNYVDNLCFLWWSGRVALKRCVRLHTHTHIATLYFHRSEQCVLYIYFIIRMKRVFAASLEHRYSRDDEGRARITIQRRLRVMLRVMLRRLRRRYADVRHFIMYVCHFS